MIKSVEGNLYNLTFETNKIIRGFWLLVDDEGEEFIVQQNFSYLVLSNLSLIERFIKQQIHSRNTQYLEKN